MSVIKYLFSCLWNWSVLLYLDTYLLILLMSSMSGYIIPGWIGLQYFLESWIKGTQPSPTALNTWQHSKNVDNLTKEILKKKLAEWMFLCKNTICTHFSLVFKKSRFILKVSLEFSAKHWKMQILSLLGYLLITLVCQIIYLQ